ncbi:GNAT family acetyltransferase Nat4 [Pyrenophora tritici-repentis]|nr:GNAT family acetyltransferase Nat4 [Pyrenophora tritici-repentis]
MLFSDIQASKVQKVLQEDASGLVAYESSLQFDLKLVGLDDSELEACLTLVEYTSKNHYQASSMGWSSVKKIEEMEKPDMIFLLVREKTPAAEYFLRNDNNPVLGYISFMFDFDDPPNDDREVLYIYEIHLDDHLRGQGLGSRLISFVENVARECQIEKTMLTVFTANKGAKRLYEALGYTKDTCSPEDKVIRTKTIPADYVIMSKMVG